MVRWQCICNICD